MSDRDKTESGAPPYRHSSGDPTKSPSGSSRSSSRSSRSGRDQNVEISVSPAAMERLAQWAKNPLVLLAVGLGGGTVGSGVVTSYVSPLVQEAIVEHEHYDRAHDLDRLEERLGKVETKLDSQGKAIAQMNIDVQVMIAALQAR